MDYYCELSLSFISALNIDVGIAVETLLFYTTPCFKVLINEVFTEN